MAKKTTLSKKVPAATKAKPGKKATAKKMPAPKSAPLKKKVAAKKPAPAKKQVVKKAPIKLMPRIAPKAKAPTPTVAAKPRIPPKHKFDQKTLDAFRNDLLQMRERLVHQAGSMKNAALQRTDEENPEEDGTDAFMRLQTLEQVSSQQEILQNIDTALRAIDAGVYGVCDNCGELISRPRLLAMPFAKFCVNCQAEMERMNRGGF